MHHEVAPICPEFCPVLRGSNHPKGFSSLQLENFFKLVDTNNCLFIYMGLMLHRILRLTCVISVTEVICAVSQGAHTSSSFIFAEIRSLWLQETSAEAALMIRKVFVPIQSVHLPLSVPVLTLNKYVMALLLHNMLSNTGSQIQTNKHFGTSFMNP